MIVAQEQSAKTLDLLATQALESRLLGSLIHPGEEGYEAARRGFNLAFDRYPALIVRAADAADVIRAVEFARTHDLPLAVRSGGHSLPGYSTTDGGLVVDLSQMKAVSVDPARRTVWLQPGARTADLVAQAEPHGLVLSTGDAASVGIGGLALGGGVGWLVRKHGLTIDSLLSVEIVTADGRLIVANADENPDLFWAVRGGGGNFGIVTGFEFQLQPLGTILGGALVLPATSEVLRGFADYVTQAPDELTTIASIMQLPPIPFVPETAHGQLAFVILIAYAGDLETGNRVVDPLRALATPIAEVVGPMPYSALYQFTEMAEAPAPATVRSGFMEELSDDAIELILDHVQQKPAPMSMVQLRGLGGAMARVPKEATAFAHRDKSIFLAIINIGGEVEDRLWVEDLWESLYPHTSGVYVNFLMDEGDGRIRDAYPSETYARLAEVKRRYDPTNLFRLNQNIKPAE